MSRTYKNYNLTKEFIEEKFINQELSISQIAKEVGCKNKTIITKIVFFKIDINDGKTTLVGMEFGNLKVIERIVERYSFQWKCVCKCGNEMILLTGDLIRKSGKRSRKSCGQCCPRVNNKRSSNHYYAGYQEISGSFWSRLVYAAKNRGLEIDIDIEYIWDLFIKQERKCALTGIELIFSTSEKVRRLKETTASLDRIDSSKGYIKGNLQWIFKDLQNVKRNLDEDYFKLLCHLVVEHDKIN